MVRLFLPVLLVLAGPAASGPEAGAFDPAQVTIHERVIVRVPRMRGPVAAPVRWREKKGPRCVAAQALAGALISKPGAVDLVLSGGRRVRAKLDGRCQPLDYYSGFYVRPAADGAICADRDVIRTRSGMSCGIDAFRELRAVAQR